MNLHRASAGAGLSSSISRAFRPRAASLFCSSGRSLNSLSQNHQATFSGCPDSYKSNVSSCGSTGFSILGSLSQNLASLKVKQTPSLSCALAFRSFIHSGDAKKADTGSISRPDTGSISRPDTGSISRPETGSTYRPDTGSTTRPMDFVRGIIEESGIRGFGGFPLSPYTVEQNADIVHMKLLRNNTFITLTDSKGNRKPGERLSASAGSLPDKGGKVSRYGAEAAAEHVGREARKAGVKSIVVKVNGFTFFKKKRQAIMAFREGFTRGRGDQSPIVYIEDTTRRPHNGCRRPKKRRI
ncbi:small ribosomal subunit protein uS11m-like isoform X2 [Coffea arabica]|uniref:Small ribosomal subunit protein uS11m-like isoform X2 n=1 Tax=Coffea arabica TaxID=13443 RepID=A0A6P6UY81_COFAR|nr:probable ribosomal protein S11, mitochondrial [Coffea arabica]